MSILQGTIPSDWNGEYCRYAVCWPNSPQWLAILRGVLVLPSRGRFWDEHTGNIVSAQDIIRETFDQNLHLKGVIMACDDPGLAQIAIALTKIATAMTGQGPFCCESIGSGGAGAIDPPLNPGSPGDPDTDPPPDGYESWEEFYNDKCAIAHDILTEMRVSLQRIAIINFGALTLDAITIALTIALTLAVPAAAIIGIAALLVSAVGEIIVTTLLSIINDNEDDLVCQLYEGEDANQSFSNFHTALGAYVDSGVGDPVQAYAIKTLATYMVNHTEVNRMYTKDLTKVWPAADCQGCAEACSDCIRRYDKDLNPLDYYPSPADWQEVDDQGGQGLFTVNYFASGPDSYRIRFRNLIGHTHYATPDYILERDDSDIIYSGDSFAAFVSACEDNCIATGPHVNWRIRSSTQFTVEVKTEFCF